MTNPTPSDELLVFIGYAADAEEQAGAMYTLEHQVQEELRHLREAQSPIPFSSVKFWKWKEDASNEVGNQHTLIDPAIEQAQVAVFVFRNRIGKVTWEELERCRMAEPPKMVLALFPKGIPEPEKSNDDSYIEGWSDLLKKKKELIKNWTSPDACNVRPCADYVDIDSLKEIALERFKDILVQLAKKIPLHSPPPNHDNPGQYLKWLEKECGSVYIRGLQVSGGVAHKYDIEELYTPLYTVGGDWEEERERRSHQFGAPHKVSLDQVLTYKHTIVIGDPGSGKSTFLRHVATILCRTRLGIKPEGARDKLGLEHAPLPLFIRISELANHLLKSQASLDAPKQDETAAWIFHYLADRSETENWGLGAEFFRKQCKDGEALLLFDGLDEAPGRVEKERMAAIIRLFVQAYGNSTVIVSSRPGGYEGDAVLRDFTHCTIAALEEEGIRTFLGKWSAVLHQGDEQKGRAYAEELQREVSAKPEIRRIAVNPVMLTALAVLYYNGKRLPEQRAELYESIITWLLRAREKKPGRIRDEDSRRAHQLLAYTMQNVPGGRLKAIDKAEAYAAVYPLMPGTKERDKRENAIRFIEAEELDSGIIVSRGTTIEFWHLTFQEYLAARELSGFNETEQKEVLFTDPEKTIHNPEWRETLLLFADILYRQGVGKVNTFFKMMLDKVGQAMKKADVSERLGVQARCFGLMGAMMRDLSGSAHDFQVKDPRYNNLRDEVMGIFDPARAGKIDIKIRCEAGDALGQAGDPRLREDLRDPRAQNELLVKIPAGEFLMGAQKTDKTEANYDADAEACESPVHMVKLGSYAIGRYPVTVAQFQSFMEEDGYNKEDFWQAGGWGQWQAPQKWADQKLYPNRPVIYVSWFEAMAFCAWAKLELPTEAQWERAARGPRGEYKKYPWGNEKPEQERANYDETKIGHVSPVGCFPAGRVVWDAKKELWLADLAGNVWEWCRDWFDVKDFETESLFYRKSEDDQDPVNLDSKGVKESRVLRGGSWDNVTRYLRSAIRIGNLPDSRDDDSGFRCVSTRPSATPESASGNSQSMHCAIRPCSGSW